MFKTMVLTSSALTVLLLGSGAHASYAAPRVPPIPPCQTSTLALTLAGGSAGVGHAGVQFRVRNLSAQGCRISGYATTMLLDPTRRPLATVLHWGPGYLAGKRPVQSVHLAPGDAAYFVVEWVHMPSPGQACPAARYLLVLPPATSAAVLVAMAPGAVTACGGALTVSPVESSPFAGF